MNRKRKTEVDLIGRELFAQAGLEAGTVEKIAASPDAYGLVLERIKESRNSKPLAATSDGSRLGIRRIAATAMALFVVSFVSFSLLEQDDIKDVVSEIEIPAIKPETARPETPPGDIESEHPTGRVNYPDTVVENVPAIKPQPRRRATVRKDSVPKAEFVSLGLPGTPQQTADGGRVIRVELPAASLFAMGVNVPIENGSAMVRADLIVGQDGITRAVKLIE
jgi:hypothetical protein